MIKLVSKKLLDYIVSCEVINDNQEERDYYQYGIEVFVSTILGIFLILLLGLLMNSFLESILFLITFIPIRQYTGGYHANTYFKCNFCLCISFLTVEILYHYTANLLPPFFPLIISIIFISTVLIFCPIENKNKPLNKNKIVFYKIISIVIYLTDILIGITLLNYGISQGAIVYYTLLLVMLLIITTLFTRGEKAHVEKQ